MEKPNKLSEKEILINTINKKGFFLEEKAYGILEKLKHPLSGAILKKNYLPKNHNYHNRDDRVEIDLVFAQGRTHMIIECKKTDCSWIFPKSMIDSDSVSYIYQCERGLRHLQVPDKKLKIIRSEPMEVITYKGKFQDDGKFLKTQNREEQQRTINKAVNQVLKQIIIWRTEQNEKTPFTFFLPVILTNAPLLYLDYEGTQIDGNSNLTDFGSLIPVNCVIYNYPEILNWPSTDNEEPIKSVFIVNIHYFKEFIEWALELDAPTLQGIRTVANQKFICSEVQSTSSSQ